MPTALLLSAYDATSHRRWREGLVAHTASAPLDWITLTRPARHFAWRMRENSASWAFGPASETLQHPHALVLATSVTDLSALRGFAPALTRAPNILYFHENQSAYPWRERARGNALHLRLQEIYAALSADALVFNTAFNHDTFMDGARELLHAMPDGVPDALLAKLEHNTHIIPVGLDPGCFAPRAPREERVQLVWNHRWEYDKAPERLIAALELVVERGLGDLFELHLLGQSFRKVPTSMQRARQTLSDQLATFGFVEDRQGYLELLSRADIALSTALHEFQGLATLEAIAAGAHPLTPDRLAYTEYVPRSWRFTSTPDDESSEVRALADHLSERLSDQRWRQNDPSNLARPYCWSQLARRYTDLFTSTIDAHQRSTT